MIATAIVKGNGSSGGYHSVTEKCWFKEQTVIVELMQNPELGSWGITIMVEADNLKACQEKLVDCASQVFERTELPELSEVICELAEGCGVEQSVQRVFVERELEVKVMVMGG